jgi:RNA methyltransferase, TrmH family
VIESRDNETLKLVRKLQERRWRDKLGLFVCEGEDLVAAATAEPVELLIAGENVEPKLLAQASSAGHPPRVVGIYRRADLPAPATRPVTLVLHRVSDPGNVGTLIRTADAFGAAVALTKGCADPTGPKALRASAGAIWRVPLQPLDSGEPGDPRRLNQASVASHKVVALSSAGGFPIASCDLHGPIVFLLGAEREGLPGDLARDLDAWIPIASESINVAAAGAIALYEWVRQNP